MKQQDHHISHKKCTANEILANYTDTIFPFEIIGNLQNNKFTDLYCTCLKIENKTVALAIATPRHDNGIQLISFFAKPSFRMEGFGSQLMLQLINFVKEETTFEKINANYKTFWPDNDSWEKILRNYKWSITDAELKYILVDRTLELTNQDWLNNYPLPSNAYVRPLDAQKIAYLSSWINQTAWSEEMPIDVRPNKAIYQTNEDCSLLLIINHDIAGWIVVQDLEAGVVQITALYIRKKYSKTYRHLGKTLIAEAIQRNKSIAKAYFGYRKGNQYIKRLIQQHFEDNATLYTKKRCQITLR